MPREGMGSNEGVNARGCSRPREEVVLPSSSTTALVAGRPTIVGSQSTTRGRRVPPYDVNGSVKVID